MTITMQTPNTIHLGGPVTEINDLAASEAITPGHLIERFNNGGVHRLRKHATSSGYTTAIVACEQSMLNKGVDDAYAANDLVEAKIGAPGASFWMLVASGQTLVVGDALESAGNGTLRKYASGQKLFTALEDVTAVVTPTRIKVEAM